MKTYLTLSLGKPDFSKHNKDAEMNVLKVVGQVHTLVDRALEIMESGQMLQMKITNLPRISEEEQLPIEKVVFYSTSDREGEEGIVSKLAIDGQVFGYVLYEEFNFRKLYNYLRSHGQWEVCSKEEIKELGIE